MTTEERFTRIENALQTVTENQARQDSAIRDLILVSRTLVDSQVQMQVEMQQMATQLGNRLQQLSQKVEELAETQKRNYQELTESAAQTNEKLNALIDVVDRIIRREQGKS